MFGEGISFSSFEQIKEGDILIVKETFETRGDPKEIIRLGWKLKVYEIDKEDKMIVVADFEKKILKNQQYCTYYDIMTRLAPDNVTFHRSGVRDGGGKAPPRETLPDTDNPVNFQKRGVSGGILFPDTE